jgi:glycosyltransferase involved in cell wall biosynthesis
MSDTTLVSAIVIFLNCEQFLEEAIESILAQTYKKWELLLVDDGSTDGSTTIAQQYAQKYPDRVRYLEHKGHQNRGMSASRNLGIYHAKGDYIGFLDADDVWLPDKLEQQLDVFNRYPEAAMVYGRTLLWHSWDGQDCSPNRDYFWDLGVQPNNLIQPPRLLRDMLTDRYQKPTTCNALIRREVFEKWGLFEESFRSMCEDQVFYTKVLLHAPVYVADTCWAKYRQRSGSCMAQNVHKPYHVVRKPFLTWVKQYFKTQNVQDAEVIQVLKQELWRCHHPRLDYYIRQFLQRMEQFRSSLKQV